MYSRNRLPPSLALTPLLPKPYSQPFPLRAEKGLAGLAGKEQVGSCTNGIGLMNIAIILMKAENLSNLTCATRCLPIAEL